jgi:hypothetical protein
MKNWKQSVFLGMVAIIAFIFGFIGCGNDNGKDDPVKFTVTFDLDGGNIDGVTASVEITVKSGEKIENFPNPQKEGNTLGGWFSGRNGTGNEFTAIMSVTENATIFAKWNEIQPIEKTYDIVLIGGETYNTSSGPQVADWEGEIEFVVEYKAMPSEEPAYLVYLKTRFEAFAGNQSAMNIDAIVGLLKKGTHFTINVEYTEGSYGGLLWDNGKQSFKVHNDWITTAEGVSGDNALTLVMMREAFNSVVIE